jgi:hypothetical protein
MIRSFSSLRRRFHEPNNPDLDSEVIGKRLRNSRVLGHNLEALLVELLAHYHALEFQEEFPASTKELVELLDDADNSGTAFRYAGQLPDTQESLDFPDLVALLDNQFTMLGAVEDSITEMYAATPQPEEYDDWY